MPAFAQRGGRGAAQSSGSEALEEGIPVTDSVTLAKCGTCHQRDAKSNLSRISWERTTPEGWEEAIKRMVRLNGLSITPDEARHVVKYLSSSHGLAPEEAKSVMYIPEFRILDETNIPNDTVRTACATCHPFGRPLSWRRTKDDWKLLANFHTALFPHAFIRGPAGGGGGRGGRGSANATHMDAVDAAVEFLGTNARLHTPEWAAWQARMREPKLSGRWLVSAYIPGRGKYYGEVSLEPGAAEDEFSSRMTLHSIKDGSTLTRSGHGVVYAGYSWRGRSQASGKPDTPDSLLNEMRETMWFSPDESYAEGRWFWGEYQEFGVNVKLQRASTEPKITAADVYGLKTGSQATRIRIFGDNLPATIAPADIDFGSGLKTRRVVSHTPSEVVVDVDAAADATPGKRDIAIGRALLPNAIAVYDRVDYIRVRPEGTVARLGSDVHPKGYQQFEAIGYQRGADGKPHTADDVEIGPVDVTWSVEEFMETLGDDDKDFVGVLGPAGLFTPALDGPDSKRRFSRNNYGNVWVVATAKNEKDQFGKPLIGKSYLVVTVPTYVKWDQTELSR